MKSDAMMPAEWRPHERTWMEFPPGNETFGDDLDGYRSVWMSVANTIAQYEPVTMLANVGDRDAVLAQVDDAAKHPITVIETRIDDAWFRDSGPTFTIEADGSLGAVHWTFNAWGNAGFSTFDNERHTGRFAAELAGVPNGSIASSDLVNEGGGIHVDGEGTVLVTDTVQLDPSRNPHWSRTEVEAELHARLGTTHAIWLPRGLTRDYDRLGTRGHVDIVTCFVRPGILVAHVQPDPRHPDHDVCRDIVTFLRSQHDASGRQLEVVEIAAPTVLSDRHGWVDYSYINHYVCNDAVVLCAFDDPRDEQAAELLADLYPEREVVLVDARRIFEVGGGIHCITQQQPATITQLLPHGV
ncbi:MAG TPA: agmatine deiminase family protein [Ilumatobacter sp.]|nr:agmatine deiminase family protein [Ilumatobacter sp.]